MKILFLTYYFQPDLCAGSFRNSSLLNELNNHLDEDDYVDVITTIPNRYDSFKVDEILLNEKIGNNINVNRIEIPLHTKGFTGQIKSFKTFYLEALKLVENKEYDVVYASSSRLFTGFLGAKISNKMNAKFYLDIRDIFRENITEVFSNKILQIGIDNFLKPIEKYTFKRADHINLVSEGFIPYFKNYNSSITYFTNGIDEIFLKEKEDVIRESDNRKKTIVYGGNIGEGQGLETIIPKAAVKLGNEYEFIIIGDGGTKSRLIEKSKGINNIRLLNPVERIELIDYYSKADFLFLHLNDYKAFEKVLPSKLFEYATYNVPIIAGVGGYAAKFIKDNLTNYILFKSKDVNSFVDQIRKLDYKKEKRSDFINKFSRVEINKKMAKSILQWKK